MLKSIDINGLAVVDQLNLELDSGMTVLTGETGAGKSILLTAMKLCLGERADANLLRPGVKKADISLDFDIGDAPPALRWLQDNDFNEGDDCLIRRTVSADGRSRAFINGQAVNLKTLQQLSVQLISIHGQHAHLDLLLPAKQSQLLDASLTSNKPLNACHKAYEHWKSLADEAQELTDGNDNNDSEKQLLKYQINELEEAGIIHLDYDTLVQEHATASNISTIIDLAETQISTLYDDENSAIHTQLSYVSSELKQLADLSPVFSSVAEQIVEATIQIQEACRDLRQHIDKQDDDPQQLVSLDKQLSLMHDLARKLRIDPQQLLEKHDELCKRLNLLESRNERLSILEKSLVEANTAFQLAASSLHVQRVESAKSLSTRITKTLQTLGLPDGKIKIQVSVKEQENPQYNGLDDICFLITTNPGMPPSPIGKVASGGELSRISLAIQVVATENNTTPTLVFDEVDAGIGGGVAETVGMCLRGIATNRQVLCVTHLPQVASQGHQHLFVSKDKSSGQTKTQISTLQQQTRVEEIARMLGGVKMSDKTLAHAQEMLDKAI